MLSNNVAWIEGESKSEDIVSELAAKIEAATWGEPGGAPVTNRWTKVYEASADMWVTYQELFAPNKAGMYKHTDGKLYPVTVMADWTKHPKIDSAGFVPEISTSGGTTGRKLQVDKITYTAGGVSVSRQVAGLLLVRVPDPADITGTKFFALIVEQRRQELDGSFQDDKGWNEFQFVAEMPAAAGDYVYALGTPFFTALAFGSYGNPSNPISPTPYTFSERYYSADPVRYYDRTVVLNATPDVPNGMQVTDYYVMFKVPTGQYNYFDVYHGTGFIGTNSSGLSSTTYDKACDSATVKYGMTPTIISQKEAEAAYKRWNNPAAGSFVAPSETWDVDANGTKVISPPAHFFYASDSVVAWVTDKKRRADYFVSYWISVNNNRVSIMLEGDPAPDMDAYYRSFAYIGKMVPFADYDHPGNFGITTGMGHLELNKTGIELKDIAPSTNPIYAGYGRYTSNGVTSVSMLRTRSSVLFQSYYPAFITQLPNYTGVGTIPNVLSTLVLERSGFQASAWTDKYHASPIYLVHQYEGYRGYMDGVVAISAHNLINLDELLVETDILKDPADPSKGTWTEVYKFFSIKTPVSFLKSSANPDECSVAILKEIK
ncbi:hypothetical protein ACP26L_36330 (plasmid) [Paenibacillus sp. S-38]|uniref:hypothetical protein n=1 Tax=Paenibacillus sp. S-38 TaxID=3416710 RepID=UPI003CEF5916